MKLGALHVFLLVAALAIAGLVLWARERSKTAPSHDYKITYTSAGFVPAYLSIPVGSRVAFINNTNMPLLVASDPFPAHTDYPQFVAPKMYTKGQTYIFTFTKRGTFGYDNDKNITDRGFVQVTDSMHPPIVVDETPTNQLAARGKLLSMFIPGDPDSIFTVFDAIEASSSLTYNCHDMGHSLGHQAYEMYGFSDAMTYSNPNSGYHTPIEDICAGGYMHGILEEAFDHQPEMVQDPGTLCAGISNARKWNCYHGVGHALMFVYKRNIPEVLAACRILGSYYDTYCFEGAYMEFFWGDTDHSGPNTLYWNMNDPLASCLSADSDAKGDCFEQIPLGYLRLHSKDYAGVAHLCAQSGLTDTEADDCLKGLGILMISRFDGSHLERAEVYAQGLTYEQKNYFYKGLLSYALFSAISRETLSNTCNLMANDTAVCLSSLSHV